MVRILATCTIIRRAEALSQQIHNKDCILQVGQSDACISYSLRWPEVRNNLHIHQQEMADLNYNSYTQWNTMQLEKMRCGKYMVQNIEWATICVKKNGNIGKKKTCVYVVITYAYKGIQKAVASGWPRRWGERQHFTMHIFAYFEFLIM